METRTTPSSPRSPRRDGFVMISVLFVLLALLVLCAPFLATARNANHHSQQLADQTQARLGLGAAGKHARLNLAASHPGAPDETPYWDDLVELTVEAAFDPEFLDPHDPRGVMWDLDVSDVAGLIDLNSASPMVLANVLGMTTRLTDVVDGQAGELPVRATDGFDPQGGFLWIRGELVRYQGAVDDGFTQLERGWGTVQDEQDGWLTDGPRPPSGHGVGTHVLDQRAFAPAIWRLDAAGDEPRRFDSLEQLAGADRFALAGGMGAAARMALADACSVYGGVRAGDRWQRPVRLVSHVEGGETLAIAVDDPRYVNPGATIWIGDGRGGELCLVQELTRSGQIRLERELQEDYDAWTTIVKVLRKRPVNLNTAPREVLRALFQGLQLRGRNDRITEREAEALMDLVLESRPFTGFEDFMRRIVLPASGLEELPPDAPLIPDALGTGTASIIDAADAVALYLNGLNANDGFLEFATMPFCFVSRDVYAMDLRASVNARSGVERTRAQRERVELVVPQRELFTLWGTQEDFDESMRLSRAGLFWATGPESTTRFDGSSANPPSRAWPHLGTLPSGPYLPGYHDEIQSDAIEPPAPVHTFPSREGEDDYAQLWVARTSESGRREGRVLHFDHETLDPEGRYLPERRVLRAPDHQLVQWALASEAGLLRSLSFEMWVKPTGALGDGLLLDVAGTSEEVDRVSLSLEGPDLVLRVIDGFGDHRDSPGFVEATEVRYAIGAGDGPGLPPDTWSHVALDVEGTRPDQVDLLVNGMAHGVRRLGLTRLAAAASQGDGGLVVESVEGFPPRGVARVGNELIEYVLDGQRLLCAHQEAGTEAGFGGRLARTRWTFDGLPANLGGITTDHPRDTMVQVYGYSIPLASNVPGGGGSKTLGGDLGPFRVARVVGLDGQPDPILAGLFYFGLGYEAANLSGLMLALGDDMQSEVMDAFNPDGGYALIVQQRWRADQSGLSASGAPLGGFEIIRYSGYSGNVLHVIARGSQVMAELPRYGALDPAGLGGDSRVYVIDWESTSNDDGLVQEDMGMGMYVLPISLSVVGATVVDFLQPAQDRSEFAQIARTDQAELTEWVRYDTVQVDRGQLVRDHPDALIAAYAMIVGNRGTADDLDGVDPGGPGNPGDPGDPGGPGGPPAPPFLGGPPLGGAAPAGAPAARPRQGANWDPYLGESEIDEHPLSRAVWSVLQFRGVLETHTHTHPAGTPVTPVFQLQDRGVEGGRPGARDTVFLSGEDAAHFGWPLVVHRAHLPLDRHVVHSWIHEVGGEQVAQAGPSGSTVQTGFQPQQQFVALSEASPEPMVASAQGQGSFSDPRLRARLVKFPSGERPRVVGGVAIGGGVVSSGGLPSAVVDEVVFGAPDFLTGLPGASPASHTQAASMRVDLALDAASDLLEVGATVFIVPDGLVGGPQGILSQLPEDAGLLRVGDELMCYDSRDVQTGQLILAPGGRGLLGTLPQPHQPSEPVAFLEHMVVSTLSAGIGAGDSNLPLESLDGFPSRGLVLIDQELVHYTRQRAGSLEMPRIASAPGAMDEDGAGIFRGRFGTQPAAHAAGTPVILFPFRYWDLWAEQADAPELSYLQIEVDQPGAWWKESFWDAEEPGHGQCRIGVLMRTDPDLPWDADPDEEPGLTLMYEGRLDDEMIPVGAMSDRIEWRVFVEYDPGAFDPFSGLAHGWKETPRLRRLGVGYLAPGQVLRSIDR